MAGYLDYSGLQRYDTKLKAYMASQDAEVLNRAGVSIEKLTTPTTGSAATYVVKQDFQYVLKSDGTTKISADEYKSRVAAYNADQKLTTPTGVVDPSTLYDAESKEVSKIEIPLDQVVESGSLVTTAKTATDPAKAEIVLVLANTTDATTTSGKKEVRVDISAVAGDITSLTDKVTALEATHATKVDATSGDTVLKTVTEQIVEEAKTGVYKAESAVGAGDGETIGAALTRFEDDLTYKGVATAQPTSPAKGDLYNFNISATDPDGVADSGDETAEVKGWKFWDGSAWQSLDDPTLAARVGVLEGQVGKDKAVTAYKTKTDLVDIVNVLTGADTVDGSALNVVYNKAADAKYGTKTVYEDNANPGTIITAAAYQTLVDAYNAAEAAAPGSGTDPSTLYTAKTADKSIKEAIQEVASEASTTLVKNTTATAGAFASYHLEQNGVQVGATIDIPKDFLVKSAEIKTAPTGGLLDTDGTTVLIPEDHKYIDFVVNSKDATDGTGASHIYLDVLDLVNDFTVKDSIKVATDKDEVQLAVSKNRELSATLVDASIARKKIDADFEANLKAIEDAIGYVDPAATTKVLQSVSDTIEKEAKDAIYTSKKVYEEIANTSNVIDATAYAALSSADQALYAEKTVADKTIAQAIKALEDSASDTNGAFVMKGDVADLTALNAITDPKKGDAYYVTDVKSLYIRTATAWKKLAVDGDFTVGNGGLNKAVDIKKYIDSRIFIGNQTEVDAALAAGDIDDSTFIIVTDSSADSFEAITNADIDNLF